MNGRHLLSLSLLCLTAGGAVAQGITHRRAAGDAAANMLKPLHLQQGRHTAAKGTSVASRLIADAFLQYDTDSARFVPEDSVYATYSGGRGGDLASFMIPFDVANGYLWNGQINNYQMDSKEVQTFDANNNVETYIAQAFDTATLIYINQQKQTFAYDGNNNLLSQLTQYWDDASSTWTNAGQYLYTYDASDNITSETDQEWNSGAWQNTMRYLYTYTAANKLNTQKVQEWNTTGSEWNDSSETDNTYDADNNEIASVTMEINQATGALVYTTEDSMAYTGGQLQTTTYLDYDVTTATWQYESRYKYSNYSGIHPLTIVVQQYDSSVMLFYNSVELLYTYNTYGQVTQIKQLIWATGNVSAFWELGDGAYLRNFYYEDYNALAVNNIGQAGGTARIYPVPAQTDLQIDLSWDNAQDATITIYDMQGRLYRRLQTGNAAQYHKTMNVTDLAAGNYIISINGEKGSIVKQLTVAH